METKEKKEENTEKEENGEEENKYNLSDEEKRKKEDLETLVKIVCAVENPEAQKKAIANLKKEIRASTASVTSVPIVLKLLVDSWETLKAGFTATAPETEQKTHFADVMSVLSMTMGEPGDCIFYKLLGDISEVTEWGYEYVRFLSHEIGLEFQKRDQKAEKVGLTKLTGKDIWDLRTIIDIIVPYLVKKNHEPQAIDLLLEVDLINTVEKFVTKFNYKKVCRYLIECAHFFVYPENDEILKVCYQIYRSEDINNQTSAMRIAMIMNDEEMIRKVFHSCKDKMIKRQLAFMLTEFGLGVRDIVELSPEDEGEGEDDDDDDDDVVMEDKKPEEVLKKTEIVPGRTKEEVEKTEGEDDEDDDWEDDDEEDEEEILDKIISNEFLTEHFQHMAKELDAMDPKTAEEVFRDESGTSKKRAQNLDSAKKNLATTYVNALANAGFGVDKLMTEQKTNWVHRNKDHGKIAASASIGMVFLWDNEEGLNRLDRYLHSTDMYVKAGALLGMGISSCTIRNEADPCFGILQKYLVGHKRETRICSLLGLGIAHAGSRHQGCLNKLMDIITDESEPIDIVCIAGLVAGMIFVGGAKSIESEDILAALNEVFTNRPAKVLKGPFVSYLCLGVGLFYMGLQEDCKDALTVAQLYDPCVSRFLAMTIECCAYAGTGNVLKIQQLVSICGQHPVHEQDLKDKEWKKMELDKMMTKEDTAEEIEIKQKKVEEAFEKRKKERGELDLRYQSTACLGIALVAMGEDIGSEMVSRVFNHILHYCEKSVKKAVPLSLGLLHLSDPKLEIMDILSKLSHDSDSEVSQSAILSLGLIGAGTNNSRLAQMLRRLADYYSKEPHHLYTTRIAQGLLYMGKGLLTMSPFFSDRKILRMVSLAGILPVLFSALNMRTILDGPYHYFLYTLSTAISPRMLITVDDKLEPIPVQVRVGTAVDTVAKAGHRKTITGFQQHGTPVLLQYNERAELATEKYISLLEIMEGVVIMKKRVIKDDGDDDDDKKKK